MKARALVEQNESNSTTKLAYRQVVLTTHMRYFKSMKNEIYIQIAELGDPVIRQKAKPITNFGTTELKKLIKDLKSTCVESEGVGISAPQIRISKRLFIISSTKSPIYKTAKNVKPFEVINPKILDLSKEVDIGYEGCLSIPGIRGKVSRPKKIKVEYYDFNGRKKTAVFKDFMARVFLHEYDHLEGIVFTDKVESKTLITGKEFSKMIRKQKKK